MQLKKGFKTVKNHGFSLQFKKFKPLRNMKTNTFIIMFFLLFLPVVICSGQTEKSIAKNTRYVIAPSGLSLRKQNSLKSEKILVMPLGSKVHLLEEAPNKTIEVEYIKGGMHKVSYNGLIGYCFSGYLSSLYLPKKKQTTEEYLYELQKHFSDIKLESKPTDSDFHEGNIDMYSLPASSWHEIFYLIRGIYLLPKSFSYPNPLGPNQEIIADPKKPEDVWSSTMTFTRNAKTLESIRYVYRTEGFGFSIEITAAENGFFAIKHLAFVD